ncbi:MAG TPA: helix-turn-helix domain-containing protein [Armatimonadota bacterium]
MLAMNAPDTTPTLRLASSSETRGGFTVIDNQFLLHYVGRLDPRATTLYLILSQYADYHTGVCFPKLATLAERLGVNERSIRRQLRTLEEKGGGRNRMGENGRTGA